MSELKIFEDTFYRVKDPDTGIEYNIPDMSANHDLIKVIADSAPPQGVRIPPEQKIAACALWTVLGSSAKVSRVLGINERTIRHWYHEPWWAIATREIRKTKNEELDATLTGLLEATVHEISDRLRNGENILDKNGELRKVPVNTRTLATTLGVVYDKRALLRGDPTSKVARVDVNEHLNEVARKLEKLVGKIPEPTTVEGEFAVEEVIDGT